MRDTNGAMITEKGRGIHACAAYRHRSYAKTICLAEIRVCGGCEPEAFWRGFCLKILHDCSQSCATLRGNDRNTIAGILLLRLGTELLEGNAFL
ncbi:hypothetical protein [Prosthecobacter sp.]|uniref:hypothetical protein n=1 Tax=Prosthecobacter sp. TaxID=1965333 RepID=UPI0037C5828B